MNEYPLLTAAGLRVGYGHELGDHNVAMVRASDVEAWLERAPVLWANEYNLVNANDPFERLCSFKSREHAGSLEPNYTPPTHRMRAVCVQPIVRDTAEGLLQAICDAQVGSAEWMRLLDRARKLLSEHGAVGEGSSASEVRRTAPSRASEGGGNV